MKLELYCSDYWLIQIIWQRAIQNWGKNLGENIIVIQNWRHSLSYPKSKSTYPPICDKHIWKKELSPYQSCKRLWLFFYCYLDPTFLNSVLLSLILPSFFLSFANEFDNCLFECLFVASLLIYLKHVRAVFLLFTVVYSAHTKAFWIIFFFHKHYYPLVSTAVN